VAGWIAIFPGLAILFTVLGIKADPTHQIGRGDRA